MDDLNGLDWSANSNSNAKAPVTGSGNYYPSLRPTPPPASSGRNTPLSAQGSGFRTNTTSSQLKSSTPDSFSNLVSFGSGKQNNNLSLLEQQQKLQAEKAKKEAEKRKQYESQFGHSQFWDGLGDRQQATNTPPIASRSSTPALQPSISSQNPFTATANGPALSGNGEDDDLFAAFNKDTKVDKSSHYPPPSIPTSGKNTPVQSQGLNLNKPQAWENSNQSSGLAVLDDDDDPFGLGQMGARTAAPVQAYDTAPNEDEEDDDLLGDLGRPVEEVRRQAKSTPVPQPVHESRSESPDSDDPWDKAVNELVDMGFSAENSRRALTESGAGLDVQVAVGWLLNDAHKQAKEKAQGKPGSTQPPSRERASGSNVTSRDQSMDRSRGEAIPPWMRQEGRDRSQPRRDDSRSPANSDSDLSRTAAAMGSNLLKTANSLWKTSQKKVQKAVSEFQQEGDPTQPKWMRPEVGDFHDERQARNDDRSQRMRHQAPTSNVTDEALLLEADSRPPPRKSRQIPDQRPLDSSSSSRDQSPAMSAPSTGRSTPAPRWQQTSTAPALDAKSRLNKQAIEEQSAQAYVSPARRKKPAPPQKAAEEPDLLFGDSGSRSSQPVPAQRASPMPSKSMRPVQASAPIAIRPKAPTRNIPSLSTSALASSSQHRLAGTAHFKRGDYAAAHASYSSSLSSLPQGHPITIILLCNRSLTALKTGEPKSAVVDADTALSLIGPSRGESEFIDLQGSGPTEGKKDMKEFWGKALMRKAEALEQMERWSDAAGVWKEAVEAGVGGATSAQGRQRCEKALLPKPKPNAHLPPKPAARPKPSALNDLAPAPTQNFEAVNRLRAANAAAEKADDEKFALSDSVDAKLLKWREGRKDNLRALLGALDQILWEGSGWKKVGMHELVLNGKVKINYMKAIAKVHPDKLPQGASTEIQMISAAVFATLNEAWDKFKTENNM